MPSEQTTTQILDTSNAILQAGVNGLAFLALLAVVLSVIAVIYTVRSNNIRIKSENELNGQLITSFSTNIAGVMSKVEAAISRQNDINEKRADSITRQTASTDHMAEVMETMSFKIGESNSMLGETLDRVDLNVLKVVNGFGSLDESIRGIEKAVKDNPSDHAAVVEALKNLSEAQEKIFKLIDSRLPERAKVDTPSPMRLHPATEAFRKRATDDVPKAGTKPEDTTPPDKAS